MPDPASGWRLGRAALHAAGASLRVTALLRLHDLDSALARLQTSPRLPDPLRDPALHSRAVNRLLPYLPPWRMGPCMKRSLLLFHLWSRCGLKPRLHLGYFVSEHGRREGHAWLTVEEPPLAASSPARPCVEAYVFGSV